MSFRDFVMLGKAYAASNYDICCIDGILAVDFVIRYETLADGISTVLSRVGLEDDVVGRMNELRINSQYRTVRDYRSVYDADTRAVIAQQYAREIALFGYEF